MILTRHAKDRLRERFPRLEGNALLDVYETARPPTPEERQRIAAFSLRVGTHMIGKGGVVFVVDNGVVITLFLLPTEKQYLAKVKEDRRHIKPVRQYEDRRRNEKRWNYMEPA